MSAYVIRRRKLHSTVNKKRFFGLLPSKKTLRVERTWELARRGGFPIGYYKSVEEAIKAIPPRETYSIEED